MASLHAKTERADGAGDKHLARAGFARFARYLDAARIEALHFVGETERGQLEAVSTEGIGFDDVRARFDVSLVHAKYGFRLGGVELVEAALRADGFVERSEEHTSELQSLRHLVCRLLLEK